MKKEATKKVTITINADTYAVLNKLAGAMNAVGWCGDDNTVSTIIEKFCLGGEVDTEMVRDNIVSAIDTGCEEGEAEDTAMRDSLVTEFAKVA